MCRSSREGTRGRRHETNASYPNMRNNSKDFASQGGDNNITESWSRRTDYKDGPRYNDYPHRNVYDGYRNTRIPCRYFAAGNCNRDNCKFSHDVTEAAGGYDERSLGNKNRTRPYEQQPHDDLNAKSNLGEMEKKSWNSSLWDDVKSGGFDETSRQGHTSDDNVNNNTTWDCRDDKKMWLDGHASRDASGFHVVGKSHPIVDNKTSSWSGPTSWDGASGSGFSNVSNPSHKYEESAKESLNDNNAQGRMSAKSGSSIDRNSTNKWDGPLWDECSEPVMAQTDNSKIRKWNGSGLSKMASDNIVPEDANQQVRTSGKESVHDMNIQSLSYLNGSEQSHMLLSNTFNGPSHGQVQGMHVHMEIQNKEGGKPLKPLDVNVPQPQTLNDIDLTSQLAPQANAPPHQGPISQLYSESHLNNAIDFLKSLPNSAAYSKDTGAKEEVKISVPMGIFSGSITQQRQMPADLTHDSRKLGVLEKEAVDKRAAENSKKEVENKNPEAQSKVEEGDIGNDEKAMRQFKVGLVDFVKEILKPKWKEGKMSREVHKSVVKKVVEKVTSTIQGSQIPRTQPKIDQYLTYSKPKITKLVEAYMERLLKA
ncbi:hypothetical protein L1987_53014 [Smallanthus sonchifolius]|uniref:Uncharacterized protein n=1 Tax=Smallanthus sonchifolius TaxID=185202 RepID=A0ACB9EV17_9ASTR|nr:hypothetical protein L1987_53014 [Smallanthus sonchifolius]